MWGAMEAGAEAHRVEQMSLEQAYQEFKSGNLRTVLALYAAKYSQCECGNARGTECFNSTHVEMRNEMSPPLAMNRKINESICETCACVGCSEGNCCEH